MLASLLFVLAALSLAKSRKVLVSQNNTICPENCTTFPDLLNHPDDYFTSNTVVKFQPGEYNTETYGVNSTISIVGVSNLTITSNGLELCTIKCSTGYSITFTMYNCTNITLSEIELNGCMHISKFPKIPKLCPFPCITRPAYNSTILIKYTTNITLYNMRFVNNLSTTCLNIIDTMGHLRILRTQFFNTSLTILQLSNTSGQNEIFFQFMNASFTKTGSVGHSLNFAVYIFIRSLIKVETSITFSTFSGYRYNHYIRDAINFIKTTVCTPVLMNIQNSSGISLDMDMTQCNPCRENNDHSITKGLSLKSCDYSGVVKLSGLDIITVENVTINKNPKSSFLIENSFVMMRNVQFTSNEISYPIVELRKSLAIFSEYVSFIDNKGIASSLLLTNSNITFNGTVLFIRNVVFGNGGAISMLGRSFLNFEMNINVTFEDNHATQAGGAIYVDHDYIENRNCFFNFLQPPQIGSYSIAFKRNRADYAGNMVYGGNVKTCGRNLPGKGVWHKRLGYYFQLEYNKSDTSQIGEEPFFVCKCTTVNSTRGYICRSWRKELTTFKKYPGQSFNIELVVVGRAGDTVPGTILATTSNSSFQIIPSHQKYQSIGRTCQSLQYTIISNKSKETIYLSAKGSIRQCNFLPYTLKLFNKYQSREGTCSYPTKIGIELKACPIGFIISHGVCECTHIFQSYSSIKCDINTQSIYRPSPYWISADNQTNDKTVVLVHEHCPLGYCTTGDTPHLNLLHPDSQCANNRSGILCGQCQGNHMHSLVLGGSQCRQCSDIWLLLIPVFMAAGLLLILFLTFLNMTVSVGTINGLVFFTNIVQANRDIFFTSTKYSLTYLLGIFVAWMNLDFGFNVCFYNGMNGYAKMWLQFVFPAYLWLILIVFIILSHYYTSVAKLCRRNIVSVLSTLFFLSYTKLLRTVIAILSVTYLNYPAGRKAVWLFDANIEYAKGKHLPLFLTALLVLTFFSIPYTFFLLTAQWMQYYSDFKLFKWIHRVKPIIDAHTGPYKNKYRFWTGLLLLFRVVLVIVFSTNVTGDPRINTLAIIVATSVLLLLALTGGVYKNMLINILEWSSYLSLLLLSATTLYILSGTSRNTSPLQHTVTGVCVGLSALMFLVVTSWHILQETNLIRLCKKIRNKKLVKTECEEESQQNQVRICTPTSSEIILEELEEPLLES